MNAWATAQVNTETVSSYEAVCPLSHEHPSGKLTWKLEAAERDCSKIIDLPAFILWQPKIVESALERVGQKEQSFTDEAPDRPQAEMSHVLQEDFYHQYLELFDLKQGWDGQDEEPPSVEVLSEVFRVVQEIARYSYREIRKSRYPELAPGFRGEVGLEYSGPDKELCIEIEPGHDDRPTIRMLRVSKDKGGRIMSMEKVETYDLQPAVSWLLK
jgi:hypothetical protein